jgi:hypothetical protein
VSVGSACLGFRPPWGIRLGGSYIGARLRGVWPVQGAPEYGQAVLPVFRVMACTGVLWLAKALLCC